MEDEKIFFSKMQEEPATKQYACIFLAANTIKKFPASFATTEWSSADDGWGALRSSLYESKLIRYKASGPKRKSFDMSDLEQDKSNKRPYNKENKMNSHGCVAYEPALPDNENAATQTPHLEDRALWRSKKICNVTEA